jgi:hypothetical protein
MRKILFVAALATLLVGWIAPSALAVTAKEVDGALAKARDYLLSRASGGGTWPMGEEHFGDPAGDDTEIVAYTLTTLGVSPVKDERLAKAFDTLMARDPEYVYACCMQVLAEACALTGPNPVPGPLRDVITKALNRDAAYLVLAQGPSGGWDYKAPATGRYDLSNTQLALLALREAAKAGVEVPSIVWQKALKLYMDNWQADGSWNYGLGSRSEGMGEKTPGYGSMTAAGLGSLLICTDMLDLAGGCPCRGGASATSKGTLDKYADRCLTWMDKNFKIDANPKAPGGALGYPMSWLFSVERCAAASGYKYFGTHDWYREGAEVLVKNQKADGTWGTLSETCFAALFLYKGKAPLLFNKLSTTPGSHRWWEWNQHNHDIANLVGYFKRLDCETPYAWQIVNLGAPLSELHDAPVLFISVESAPDFTAEEEAKLRQFTDTGGTILFEASCGNPNVRSWFKTLVDKVWPEWKLKPLGPDHRTFTDRVKLTTRPELFGLDDGVRTFLFYAMDDISCAWQTQDLASKKYLFDWGRNLVTYATENAPLRTKLEERRPATADRYTTAAKPAKANLSLTRVKYGDGPGWLTGRNYKAMDALVEAARQKAGLTLKVDDSGVTPEALAPAATDIAYMAGAGSAVPTAAECAGLKAFADKGGFLWIEDAAGSAAWDEAFRKLAADMKWDLRDLPVDHPVMTGKFGQAAGYNLAAGVAFRYALRAQRLGNSAHADFTGLYNGDKLIGIYSQLDVTFSLTEYDAGGCRGYRRPDAAAVAANILLLAGDRGK